MIARTWIACGLVVLFAGVGTAQIERVPPRTTTSTDPRDALPAKLIQPRPGESVTFGLTPALVDAYLLASARRRETMRNEGGIWVTQEAMTAVHEIDIKTNLATYAMVRPLQGPFAGKLVAVD